MQEIREFPVLYIDLQKPFLIWLIVIGMATYKIEHLDELFINHFETETIFTNVLNYAFRQAFFTCNGSKVGLNDLFNAQCHFDC